MVAATLAPLFAFAAVEPEPNAAEPGKTVALTTVCPETEEEQREMLDMLRAGVERSVCATAWRIDSLFGSSEEEEFSGVYSSHGRLRLGVDWDERSGFGNEFTLRAQVRLPLAQQRARAVFGRDTDEAFIEGGSREFEGTSVFEDEEDTGWLLGFAFDPRRGRNSRLSLGAGVRLRSPPDPFVQASYWYRTSLADDLLLRARQTVFWENEDGFGTSTRVNLEWLATQNRMLRWGNYARLAEGTDGVRWNTNLTLYQGLSRSRAIALRGAVRGETGRDVNPIEYKLLAIHRQRILRDWLFLEIRGGGGWERREKEESREFVPEGAVVFELVFGRHPMLDEREPPEEVN
jgi:hypothetical protein